MKNILFITIVVAFLSACQSNKSADQNLPAGVHAAVVEEVLQTTQYTYLHVKEGDAEKWLAVSKMQAQVGETYYYTSGLPMNDFQSKELNRTFKEIFFLDNISNSPAIAEKMAASAPPVPTAVENVPENTQMQAAENAMNAPVATAHKVVANEVLQTNQYTYILGKEDGKEQWLAANKFDAKVGETYYFTGGLPMTKFESKELKKTFEEILFLDNISDKPVSTDKNSAGAPKTVAGASKGSAIELEKKDIKIKHAKDEITIASLFENKKSYSGKTIKVKGQVTKFNSGIMKKNWIHIQDGTAFSGKFDLVITTNQEVKVGDNVTLEGVINLDKDFGFGYFYEVIMEDAKLVK